MRGTLDPELIASLAAINESGIMNLTDIPGSRATHEGMVAALKGQWPVIEGVVAEDRRVPGPAGAPAVPVRVYRHLDAGGKLPALLWIHGGGYMFGSIEDDDILVKELARAVGCLVVSVDYRLAPENPYPAPLEDCYAALLWLAAHTAQLDVDPRRIAIGGASAGGGLTAALALLARDRAEVDVAFQLLISPMIDDRNVAPLADVNRHNLLWTWEHNLLGWRSYLGREPGEEIPPRYAAAARAIDLAGLPPAYIPVGALDLFVYENMEYARRLLEAGIATELRVYPGAYHGFDRLAPEAAVSRRFTIDLYEALKRAFRM